MSEDKKLTIVTHSGHFHTDEIFAVATLLLVLGESGTTIVRSREQDIINRADYAVDVGGVYDPLKKRFDHHQEGGAGMRINSIPYASFGLLWKEYGQSLTASQEVTEKIDQILVQPIDAIDNGIDFIETKVPNLYPYEIGSFFESLYPSWKETNVNVDDIFMQAVSYSKIILRREILKSKDFFEARDIVLDFYNKAGDKRIIVFDKYYPSDEFLKEFPEPVFTVFPRSDGKWGINTIREDSGSFKNRKSLPESWAGKRDEEFEKLTGVEGAVFCHLGRFIAIANTKEAILKLAETAVSS